MINIDIIEREIKELEARGDTTYSVCDRLAPLYIVRDHLRPVVEESETTQYINGSDFLNVCSGVSYPLLMRILDEHMQALRIVQPKEYDVVMSKIAALH